MMTLLQRWSQSVVFKFILVVIGFSFIALGWQIGGGFSSVFSQSLAKVNGRSISAQNFERQLQDQVTNLRQRMGDAYSPQLIASFNVPQHLLDSIIQNLLVEDFAHKNSLRVPDSAVAGYIRGMAAFKGLDGQFDPNVYKQRLYNANLTVENFEGSIRTQLLKAIVTRPFGEVKYMLPAGVVQTAAFLKQKRNVNVLMVTPADVPAVAAPTQKDLDQVYEELKPNLMTPEYRTADVLVLDPASVMDSLHVSDADLKKIYDQNPTAYGKPEQREVSQILVKDEATAQKLYTQLKNGADFAQVAKASSVDAQSAKHGGDLGLITQNDVLPAFATAAFALKVGEISEPVKTPFGYHLIKVTKIIPSTVAPFAQVKDQIRKQTLADKAGDAVYNLVDNIDHTLSGGAELSDVAAKQGLKVTRVKDLTATGMAGGKPTTLPHADKLVDQIFQGDQGVASAPIDLGNNTYAFVEVNKITPSRQQTEAEVHDQLVSTYHDDTLSNRMRAKATQILADITKGQTMEQAAATAHLKQPLQAVTDIARIGPTKSVLLTSEMRDDLFRLKKGELLPRAVMTQKGAALYQVTDITEPAITQAQKDQVANMLGSNLHNDLYATFLSTLHDKATISVNAKQLKEVADRTIPQ